MIPHVYFNNTSTLKIVIKYPIFIGIDLQFAINIQVRTADVLVFRNNRDSTRSDINISAECIVIAGQCHCPTVDTCRKSYWQRSCYRQPSGVISRGC